MHSSDIISIVALALSIVAAAFSTYVAYSANRQSDIIATYNSLTSLILEIDKVFIEYPRLRPYFYNRTPIPADMENQDRDRALAVAELYLDILECIWDRQPEFSKEDEASWRDWILDAFNTSPVLSDYYSENRSWYPTLRRLHQEARSAWSEDAPPRPIPPQPQPE
jgi:hypothetical protein